MADSVTRNLKLRLSSNLTADARFNLERIDLLGSTFLVDTSSDLRIRSESDILIEPESADIGGSGIGGSLSIGTPDHALSAFNVYATTINLTGNLTLPDSAVSGTKSLILKYKSDLDGAAETTADRSLFLDLNGANRNLILGGSYSLLGGSLSLTLPESLAYTYPSGYGTPGQVWAGDGAGNWIWTSVSGGGGGGGDVSGYSTSWLPGDGTTKVVTHSLLSNEIEVQVTDDNNDLILVDVNRTTSNQITLTSSEAPAGNWSVVVFAQQ